MISARGRAFAKLGAFSIKPIVLQILQMKIYIPKIVIWISAIKMFFMTFPNLHSANPPSPTAFHKPHHANFRFESLQWSFRRVQQSGMGAFSMWCLCGFCFFLAFLIPMKDDSFSMLLLILAFHVSHYRSQTEALFLSFAFIVVATPKILLSKFSLKLSSQNEEEMKRKSFDTSSLVENLE